MQAEFRDLRLRARETLSHRSGLRLYSPEEAQQSVTPSFVSWMFRDTRDLQLKLSVVSPAWKRNGLSLEDAKYEISSPPNTPLFSSPSYLDKAGRIFEFVEPGEHRVLQPKDISPYEINITSRPLRHGSQADVFVGRCRLTNDVVCVKRFPKPRRRPTEGFSCSSFTMRA